MIALRKAQVKRQIQFLNKFFCAHFHGTPAHHAAGLMTTATGAIEHQSEVAWY